MTSSHSSQDHPYSVSALNESVRTLIENKFPLVWIEGEISNLSRPASGHLYFSLKDSNSQVRCAMFRGSNRHLGFLPANGQKVTLRARVSLYTARGDYQLIVDTMMDSGEGALRAAFEALKRKLEQEGLFQSDRKHILPAIPERIGIITSASGAALRDTLHVLKRRFPAIPVRIYPVPVQGATAAMQIVSALTLAVRRKDCDVLLLVRGGGSLEDLQAFNDERLARAISACPIAVITGIGHEIDFTIADFVADVRAPTPSAAAEIAVPDQAEITSSIDNLAYSLENHLRQRIETSQHQVKLLQASLKHPGHRLTEFMQRLDSLSQHLQRSLDRQIDTHRVTISGLENRLQQASPSRRIGHYRLKITEYDHRLRESMKDLLAHQQSRFAALIRALNTVSPLATLERGYSILTSDRDNAIIRSSTEVNVGDTLTASLKQGKLHCTVDRLEEE